MGAGELVEPLDVVRRLVFQLDEHRDHRFAVISFCVQVGIETGAYELDLKVLETFDRASFPQGSPLGRGRTIRPRRRALLRPRVWVGAETPRPQVTGRDHVRLRREQETVAVR